MNEGTTAKPGTPDGRGRDLRRRLVLGTALVTSAFIGGYRGYIRRAYAACAPTSPGTYTCSGTTTTTQVLPPTPTGTPLTVTTDDTFSIDTTVSGGSAGNAFTLTGQGGLTFTDNNQATITGTEYGIRAGNLNSGVLAITTTGAVTGTNGPGIAAANQGTDLTIKAADVSGGTYGIRAGNQSSGALSITTTGAVTGSSNDGIYARNNNAGTDLTIEAATVSGGNSGIEALNHGSGALSVTTTGTVTGGAGNGIYAVNQGTDLTIEAAEVSGGSNGIYVYERGIGALSITTTGAVTGTSYDGIFARNGFSGTDLTIEAVDVSGGASGIVARNYGGSFYHGYGSALSITATGTVEGGFGDGIDARNYGTDLTIEAATVSGGAEGIYARNSGGGALKITATGTVTGETGNGILAANYSNGTDLTIGAADVSGGSNGIYAHNYGTGVLSITTTGTVTGTGNDGIYARNDGTDLTIEAVDVSGATDGIGAQNSGIGVLSITATGTVEGESGDGIYARNDGNGALSISAADVSGGTGGIAAVNSGGGAVSIDTTGTVKGPGSGIVVVNDSTNTGSTTTVTVEDGSVVSSVKAAVDLRSPSGRAATLNNAGSISGATGVIVSGGPATLSNTGSITGTGGPAIDLTGASGPGTVNQKSGTITGAILLSAAADTVNVTGGAIAGSIVGQGSATTNLTLGSGSFTFDAPYTITGMANVNVNSGTVAIAGTINTDVLTVNDGTMSVAGAINTPVFKLNGGTLSISSDANLGSDAGALNFDGGTFENTAAFATARAITLNAGGGTFQTDANLIVTGAITGSGGLTKTGTAALTLNGVNSFTGLTTIDAGRLVVGDDAHAAASLAGDVLVNSGGTLGGMGTIGSMTIASGGTIAPGNSIGTLTVKGDITFAAGSTYVAEINPALDSDLIAASGNATIEGGTVYAAKVGGIYTPGSRWTIVGADGGVTGTFDTLDQNMPFVDLALAYDPTHVYIDATRNNAAFCMAGMTFNQCSTGNGLESTGVGNPVYDAVAALPNERAARQALDQLSGEIHASAKSALIEDSHFVRDAVNDRIRSAFGDTTGKDMPLLAYGEGGPRPAAADSIGPVAWGYAFGSWGSFDGNGNAAGMDTSTGGFLTGIDGEIASNIRLGLLAGYSHSSFEVDDRASSGNSDNYHLGLYGGGQWDSFRLSGGLAYTWHDIETGRSVAFPGFSDRLSGDYNAGTFQAFGEAGYRIDMGTVAFEPFANLAYVSLHTDGFTEKGGAAALRVSGETTDATFTTLGVHLSSAFTVGGMKATARGTVGWRHAFGDTTPLSTHAFAGGTAFPVAGVPIAKDAALIEAGLDLDLTKAATLGVAYQGQFGSGAMQNGFKAKLQVRF